MIDVLQEHDIHSRELLNKLKCMGISERTVNSVKKELGITSYKKDGIWFWHLENSAHNIGGL